MNTERISWRSGSGNVPKLMLLKAWKIGTWSLPFQCKHCLSKSVCVTCRLFSTRFCIFFLFDYTPVNGDVNRFSTRLNSARCDVDPFFLCHEQIPVAMICSKPGPTPLPSASVYLKESGNPPEKPPETHNNHYDDIRCTSGVQIASQPLK
ncbi:uncharacterized protein P174DRAFT_500103 [Aspergillus novofumigatus IBT 16806]|uniref:Uncharacterized protein n=1 Tax=Aspergillus novofumigatus (strain IBT 16806) TaxID=1392255 RepID=A0A2I1CLD4_ASPN1|nr:uncharacterized protein P174DRAFT_500103 [Aspergillus novofumigatus IBT 16806]PKX98440.1 hypothetical protein P174DRAFT_500103 [Aspergillus novofumigatus IBT 16806]